MDLNLGDLQAFTTEDTFVWYRRPKTSAVYRLTLKSPGSDTYNAFIVSGFDDHAPHKFEIEDSIVFDLSLIELVRTKMSTFKYAHLLPQVSTDKKTYIQCVEEAGAFIDKGQLQKVVLARTLFESTSTPECGELFMSLLSNEDAFVYFFHDPKLGTWCGASPELLFSQNGEQVETMALAGTRSAKNPQPWTQKETDEHKIVGDYLESVFENMGVIEVSQTQPATVQAGTLLHLCSKVCGVVNKETDTLSIAKNLHPTPALGGYPKKAGLEFIKSREAFQRRMYGGYIGLMRDNELELFVNIRCMQLGRNGVQLFAGAGINKGSNPDKEWDETEHKLSVMQGVLAAAKS